MKLFLTLLFSCVLPTNPFAQTVATLVPTNVGDDMHFGSDGNIYSSHYGGVFFRKINPNTGEVDTILSANTATIGAIEVDENLNIFTCSYDQGWVGKFVEGDNAIVNIASGLSGPAGIAHDQAGNLYVATNQNHRIIKILPNGNKEIFVQGSPLFWPTGITIDDVGNLYVTNMFSAQVVKVTPEKQMTVLATLPAVSDQTPDLAYLTWVQGKLYICHFDNHVIYEMDPETGSHQIVAGSGQAGNSDGYALQAKFHNPTGIVAAPSGDTLYITDGVAPNQRLRMLMLKNSSSVAESLAFDFESIKLFPSPATDQLSIEFELKSQVKFGFQVLDSAGKQHISISGKTLPMGRHIETIPVAKLAQGIWFLTVTVGDVARNFSFVKN